MLENSEAMSCMEEQNKNTRKIRSHVVHGGAEQKCSKIPLTAFSLITPQSEWLLRPHGYRSIELVALRKKGVDMLLLSLTVSSQTAHF